MDERARWKGPGKSHSLMQRSTGDPLGTFWLNACLGKGSLIPGGGWGGKFKYRTYNNNIIIIIHYITLGMRISILVTKQKFCKKTLYVL